MTLDNFIAGGALFIAFVLGLYLIFLIGSFADRW